MFKLAWRREGYGAGRSIIQWTYGLSKVATYEQALARVAMFKRIFPQNKYLILGCV